MSEIVEKLEDVPGKVRRFKKKPIVVRAVEVEKETVIHTREGELKAYPGDFLIEGIKKEIYPCGREIFFDTYDEVKESE